MAWTPPERQVQRDHCVGCGHFVPVGLLGRWYVFPACAAWNVCRLVAPPDCAVLLCKPSCLVGAHFPNLKPRITEGA